MATTLQIFKDTERRREPMQTNPSALSENTIKYYKCGTRTSINCYKWFKPKPIKCNKCGLPLDQVETVTVSGGSASGAEDLPWRDWYDVVLDETTCDHMAAEGVLQCSIWRLGSHLSSDTAIAVRRNEIGVKAEATKSIARVVRITRVESVKSGVASQAHHLKMKHLMSTQIRFSIDINRPHILMLVRSRTSSWPKWVITCTISFVSF